MMRLLRYDVLAPLAAADHPALGYFVRRDLLGQAPEPIDELWDSPHALRGVGRQQPDGRWR